MGSAAKSLVNPLAASIVRSGVTTISFLVSAFLFLAGSGTAQAQGLFAVDDGFTAPAERTLIVEAIGVLENDTDEFGENLPLTAEAELVGDVHVDLEVLVEVLPAKPGEGMGGGAGGGAGVKPLGVIVVKFFLHPQLQAHQIL